MRLKTTLQMLMTTSPSYVILASMDIARRQMALEGEKLLENTLKMVEEVRGIINKTPGLSCLTRQQVKDRFPGLDLDVTKLVISTRGINYAGYDLAKILNSEYGIQVELADFRNVLLFVSVGNSAKDMKKLTKALRKIVVDYKDLFLNQKRRRSVNFPSFVPQKALNPREALYLLTRKIPFKRSVGKICAEIVCPYPPGIPVLCPGEVITQEIYEYLLRVLDSGCRINGQSDGRLQTIKVLEDAPAPAQKRLFAVS
jgi:arginine/lysine/ornithine decarboxylase